MAFRGALIVTALVGSAAGLGYLIAADNPPWQAVSLPPGPAPMVATASSSAPATPQAATPEKQPPPDDPVVYLLAQVADQYQQTTRYPPYSTPLTKAQAEAYRGNVYHPVKLPLAGGGQFSVTLEKFRFTRGEDILVMASLSGPEVVARTMDVILEATSDRTQVAATTLERQDDGFYQGSLDSDVTPGEYRLVVEASVDSQPLRHVSTLTVEPDLGKFEGIGDPRVSNNDLVIPVAFDAREFGFYSLSAQLYADGQPVAQLTGEQALDGTGDEIELRAHGSVLAPSAGADTLTIKGLQIRRLPARPGDRTDHAYGPEDGFSFTPPDLDALEDVPARDPESEQRAALLRQMTAGF
ncbi:MAG: hypothetical protein R3280_00490 [Marinobacter sp.]|uniref:hypothetical protein n=1 Tax=Marinobacter sp. TaxID=50741 RepID=UPI00299D6973|nr:hypothetical protein [Marinobacter sp.]MDX1633088.1 hypothetical protein [Marinobacter sp.]